MLFYAIRRAPGWSASAGRCTVTNAAADRQGLSKPPQTLLDLCACVRACVRARNPPSSTISASSTSKAKRSSLRRSRFSVSAIARSSNVFVTM